MSFIIGMGRDVKNGRSLGFFADFYDAGERETLLNLNLQTRQGLLDSKKCGFKS